MKKTIMVLLAGMILSGCRGMSGPDEISRQVDADVRDSDLMIRESRTLSILAKIEESLGEYVKHEKRIPVRLEQLIPKYLAEIPPVEIGVRGHADTAQVEIYPADILRDGQVTGARIADRGGWGYVFNDRQAVVFVDCTHKSSRGRPWFQERGVY